MKLPDVAAGRSAGYGLQHVYSNATTPYKRITPGAHGYVTAAVRKRAGHTSTKNTYEGRTTKPDYLVARYNTNVSAIEKGGWSDKHVMGQHYQKVAFCLIQRS